MIPFFRRIRKRFADDNKPMKYARYAVGEIVLVVIGILIALQINNWKEKRIENEERNELVNLLSNEFETIIPQIEDMISFRESRMEKISDAINSLDNGKEKIPIDSLKQIISTIFLGGSYTPQTPKYSAALSSGKISLINDDVFFEHISSFNEMKGILNRLYVVSLEANFNGPLSKIKEEHWELYLPNENASLTEEEYLNYISRPDVNSTIRNMNRLGLNMIDRLKDMLSDCKSIVQNFESKK